MHSCSSVRRLSSGMARVGVSLHLYTRLRMKLIVLSTGMFVKRLSTSSEAMMSLLSLWVSRRISMKSLAEAMA